MPARIAFVVEHCEDPDAGAAGLAVNVARNLSLEYAPQILTTCASAEQPRRNVLAEGHDRIGAIACRRFSVDAAGRSRDLEEFTAAYAAYYDGFVFFDYRAGTTRSALPGVGSKAVLVPLATEVPNEEASELLSLAREIVYSSDAEREIVRRSPSVRSVRSRVVRAALPPPQATGAAGFRQLHRIEGAFVLAACGSGAEAERLLGFHAASRAADAGSPRLVISAHGSVGTLRPGVTFVERIGAAEVAEAAADLVCVIVGREVEKAAQLMTAAWYHAIPVLVDARAKDLVDRCRHSGGGLWFGDAAEFEVALEVLSDGVGKALGRQGRERVAQAHNWADAVRGYEELLRDNFGVALAGHSG